MTLNNQINAIANREFGKSSEAPNNYYLGLLLATPNPDGSGLTEVSTSGTGYARQVIGNNKTALSAALNGVVKNNAMITFPAAATVWGTITDVAIFDSPTGGIPLYVSTQSTPKAFGAGDVAFFDIGDISFTVQNIID